MNIFILDENPIKAAQYCIDRHVVKMITESAQLLANGYSLEELTKAPLTANGKFRKHSYVHHPCSKWAIESLDNWKWLLIHAIALCAEKSVRYPNKPTHFCQEFIHWCEKNTSNITSKGLTKFALAMPPEIKSDNTVEAYRSYYRMCKVNDKSGKLMAKWTNREKPEWFY